MHKTYKEIKAQYAALRKTFHLMISLRGEISAFYNSFSSKKISFTGSGSSFCLCRSAETSARLMVGNVETSLTAGDVMLNHKDYEKIFKNSLVLVPSRSGQTTEVIKTVDILKKEYDVKLISIICTKGSELSKRSDLAIELPWAFDESVCQTRSVSNMYIADLMLLAIWSENDKLINEIDIMIDLGDGYLNRIEDTLIDISRSDWEDIIILADGETNGLASEGALAFTEIAQLPGRCYSILDVRHGPMVLINDKTLVIAHMGKNGYEMKHVLVNEIIKRGAKVITYTDVDAKYSGAVLQAGPLDGISSPVSAIPFINLIQLLAYHKAVDRNIDPDEPEGITAWVKL